MKPLVSCAATLLLILLLAQLLQAQVVIETSPGITNNQSNIVYISAALGEENVTVVCSVTSDGLPIGTAWRDEAEQVLLSFPLTISGPPVNPVTTGYSFVSASITFYRNLTIDTFVDALDRLKLSCYGANTDRDTSGFVTFFYGIPIITLMNASEVYNVTEFHDFYLDLTNNNKTSFPPQVDSLWTINGNEITMDGQIAFTDYSIIISNISRNYSGKVVNLTVSNSAGERSTQFLLNVIYQPEVTIGNSVIFAAKLGDSIDIIAATDINGNPTPSLTWFDPNNTAINYGGRFSQNVEGTLTIQDLELTDFGNYRFVAANDIGNNADVNLSLIQLIQPSQPRNLSYNVISTSVVLEWNPPLTAGVPMYSNYIITFVSDIAITTLYMTNETVFMLDNLDPGTFYNVSVSAASDVFTDGGDQSNIISFTTDTSGPIISSVAGVSLNGGIYLQWSLLSTGGIANDDITIRVTCRTLMTTDVDNEVVFNCDNQCIDDNLNGSSIVGPVRAGFKYGCVLTVRNGVEFQSITSSAIDAITGIPSSPSVVFDNAKITLMTQYIGVHSNDDFTFDVRIFNEDSELVSQMNYTGSNEKEFTITLPVGSYTVDVTSTNEYGTSKKTSVDFEIDQLITPSTSPNITSKEEVSVALLSGVGGAGTALVFAIVCIVIAVIVLAVRKKASYRSMIFTSNGTLPPQQRKQFDRPRIPSVGSTVLY